MGSRSASALALLLVLFGPAFAAEKQVPQNAGDVEFSFAPVVKRVSPAVVNVYASRKVAPQASPFFGDPFFRQFFGGGPAGGRVEQSLGSGVVIDPSGLIVTNFHVIAQADDVKVALSDKRELVADIVLKDERSDLAVLRVRDPGGKLPTIEFADSDDVEVGDLVLAIGDPFGVGQTVTSGIVSAFARVPGGPSDDQYFIQTDAAINPGNSGGALVDMHGRLIGINRMIVSPSGASSGIGFAIPSNLVRIVAQAAAKGTAPRRPWLGANVDQVTAEYATAHNLASASGVVITGVDKNGPAGAAGLIVNDIIISLDNQPVDDVGTLNYRLATQPLSGSVKIGVQRDGKQYQTTLALQTAPEVPTRDAISIVGASPFAGLTVFNLSPAVAEEMAFGGAPTGVIINDVKANSSAAGAGFRRGDVIVDVNGTKIDTTRRLADMTQQSAGVWTLTVKRGDQTIRQQFRG